MKIELSSIVMKFIIEKAIKSVSFLWKHNPNYIIMIIISGSVSLGIFYYLDYKFQLKKSNLAISSYQMGQQDAVEIRELEYRLLKECSNANNVHISNVMLNTIPNDLKKAYAKVENLPLNHIGKYQLYITEINSYSSFFCFEKMSSMPYNKNYCVVNTKYLNPLYQKLLFTDTKLDLLINEIIVNPNFTKYSIETLVQEYDFFQYINANTNFKIIDDIFFNISLYKTVPYMIFIITTTEGYKGECNLPRMITLLREKQDNLLLELSSYSKEI